MKSFFIFLLILAVNTAMAETVDLAVEDEWLGYSNADGTGMSNELVKAAYKAASIDVNLHTMPYARVLLEVKQGKWVGGFNAGRQASIEHDFLWGKEALFGANMCYYQDSRRPLKAHKAKELVNNERVGGIVDYEYGDQFTNNTHIQKSFVSTHETNIYKLTTNQLDTVIIFEKTAPKILKIPMAKTVTLAFPCAPSGSPLYIAFSLKHPQAKYFADKLDSGLAAIKQSGEYAEIMRKY